MTDKELMYATSQGDLSSFRHIISRYQALAWTIAYQFLGQQHDAEDVVQDAFFKIYNASKHYQATASFRTYLYRVVSRLCIDYNRKKKPKYTDQLPATIDQSLTAEEKLIQQEHRHAMRVLISRLPVNDSIAI